MIVPQVLRDKTEQGLIRQIAQLQAKVGGKIGIITIVWKQPEKVWVCWYYANSGGTGGIGVV